VTTPEEALAEGFAGLPPAWSAIGANGVVAGVSTFEVGGRPHAITAGKTDDTVRIWDLLNVTEVGRLVGHSNGVNAVAVTKVEGKPVAVTASDDWTVRIWDLISRTEVEKLRHSAPVQAVTVATVDGQPVAFSGGDHPSIVRMFDLVRRTKIGQLGGHSGAVGAISAITVDDQPIALTGDRNDRIRIWDLRSCTQIGQLNAHIREIMAISTTTVNGRPLAITADPSAVTLWDLRIRAAIDRFGVKDITMITTGDDESLAITASKHGRVQLFDLSSFRFREVGHFDGHRDQPINGVCATTVSGNPVAISAGNDRTVRMWDLATRTEIAQLTGHTDSIRAVSVNSVGGEQLGVTAGSDGPPLIWDLSSQAVVGRIGSQGRAKSVCITTANGKRLALIGYDSDVEIWDLSSRTQVGKLSGHRHVEKVTTATVDGQALVIAAGIEDRVRIWDLISRTEIGQVVAAGRTSWVEAVAAATVNGNPLAVTASNDSTVRIWDLRSRTETGQRLVGYPDWVEAVAITIVNDQPIVITGGYDGSVRIWDLSSRTEVGRFYGNSGRVRAVTTATVHGKPVAISAGHDGIVRIFDLNASKQMHSFVAHRGPVNDIQAYESADGDHWLLSVGEDGLVRNWLLDKMLEPHSVGIDDLFAGENTGAEDQLARGELVRHLVKRLDQLTSGDRSPSPLAGDMTGSGIIHVDGRWGAGKTTFVELVLRTGWTDDAHPVIVRYDAWRQAAIAPEWWSLASEIRRAVHATRAGPTRWVMTAAGFIRRLAVSTSTWVALLSVAALALAGRWLVSDPGVPQQLDAVLRLLTSITGVLAIVFVVTRGLFWAAPVLGRLHARTDDNPLGEISGIVGHLRRWSPREGVPQRLADWLLTGCLVISVCIAVWWKPLIAAWQHAAAYWHALPASTQNAVVKGVIALSVAVGGAILITILWRLVWWLGESGIKHQRHKRPRKASTNRYVPPLTRSDVIPVIASVVTLLMVGLIGWLVIGWLIWPALTAGISRFWALPIEDRWRWMWAFATLASLGSYLGFLLVIRKRPRRMVLLIIDDLDRCAPDRVVRLLEAIHTLLRERAAPRRFPMLRQPAKFGVLVLGNGAWIRAAFRSGYKDFDRGGADAVHDLGADFLQKVFDHSVLVPDLSPEQTHDLMHVVAKSSYWSPAIRAAEPLDKGQEDTLAGKTPPGAMPANKQTPAAQTPEPDGRTADKASSPETQRRLNREQARPRAGTLATGSTPPHRVPGARPKGDEPSAHSAVAEHVGAGVAESDLDANAALLVTHLLTKYSAILPDNPRLIIRVATAWAMLRAVASSLNLAIDGQRETDLLVRAAVIWVRFPVLVDEILDADEPPVIDSNSSGCTPRWRRRDVQEVLRTSSDRLLKIEELAAYYGKFFSPEVPGSVSMAKEPLDVKLLNTGGNGESQPSPQSPVGVGDSVTS
jgi:WD40 repeat protein